MKAIDLVRMLIDLEPDTDVKIYVNTGEADDSTSCWADIDYLCDWFDDGIVRLVCKEE